jgi:hypothetical protein
MESSLGIPTAAELLTLCQTSRATQERNLQYRHPLRLLKPLHKSNHRNSSTNQQLCADHICFRRKDICLYSSVVERQSCKLKVLGSIPSGGL